MTRTCRVGRCAALSVSVIASVLMLVRLGAGVVNRCAEMVPSDDLKRAIIQETVSGKSSIDLGFLIEPACFDSVERAVAADARVIFTDTKVAYILATDVPTASVWRLLALKGLVDAAPTVLIRAQGEVLKESPSTAYGPTAVHIPIPRVPTQVTGHVPFFPAEEAGLSELWRQHSNADGRGASIAIVDDGIDLFHPAFGPVRDLKSQMVPKVLDVETLAPVGDGPDWVRLVRVERIDATTIIFGGVIWRVPDGDEQLWAGMYQKSVGLGIASRVDFARLDLRAGVLWSPTSGAVRVDTNGNRDFRDDVPIREYRRRGDVGYFGDKIGDRDDRIPFTVSIDTEQHAVNVHVPRAYHGTNVASTAAANRTARGLFDGAAPNARLVLVDGDWSAQLAGVLRALSRSDVDVVSRSGGVGSTPVESAFDARVLTRAVAIYNKPLVCLECAPGASFDVMDYQSARMLRDNRQIEGHVEASVHSMVRADRSGAIDLVLAPSVSPQAEARYSPFFQGPFQAGGVFPPGFRFPEAPIGYSVGSNVSPTVSLASGLIADLVSLARQEHVPYNLDRLRDAVFTSAELVPGWPASIQGRGIINVAKAWDRLAFLHQFEDRSGAALTTFVINSTHDRSTTLEGWNEDFVRNNNGVAARSVLVTRLSEGNDRRRYSLRLRGDVEAFQLAGDHVDLSPNVPAELKFSIKSLPGRHLAFLQLVSQPAGIPVFEIPLMATSPSNPVERPNGTAVFAAVVPPNRYQEQTFNVPNQTELLHVVMKAPDFSREASVGWLIDSRSRVMTLAKQTAHQYDTDGGSSEVLEGWLNTPTAGTWTASFSNRGVREYDGPSSPPAPSTPVRGELRVDSYRVDLHQDGNIVHVTSVPAPVDGAIEFVRADRTERHLVESDDSRRVHWMSIQLPDHVDAVRIHAVLSGESNGAALYALRCSPRRCEAVEESSFLRGVGDLWVRRPDAGDWRVALLTSEDVRTDRLHEPVIQVDVIGSKSTTVAENHQRRAAGTQWNVRVPDIVRRDSDREIWYVGFRTLNDNDGHVRLLGVTQLE